MAPRFIERTDQRELADLSGVLELALVEWRIYRLAQRALDLEDAAEGVTDHDSRRRERDANHRDLAKSVEVAASSVNEWIKRLHRRDRDE